MHDGDGPDLHAARLRQSTLRFVRLAVQTARVVHGRKMLRRMSAQSSRLHARIRAVVLRERRERQQELRWLLQRMRPATSLHARDVRIRMRDGTDDVRRRWRAAVLCEDEHGQRQLRHVRKAVRFARGLRRRHVRLDVPSKPNVVHARSRCRSRRRLLRVLHRHEDGQRQLRRVLQPVPVEHAAVLERHVRSVRLIRGCRRESARRTGRPFPFRKATSPAPRHQETHASRTIARATTRRRG